MESVRIAAAAGLSVLALTLGCSAGEDAQPDPQGGAEQEVNGERCTVFVVSDTDAMRAWNEVLNGEHVDKDFRVPGLISGKNDYDPWIRVSVTKSSVVYTVEDDHTVSATIFGDTAIRLFDAMKSAQERREGDFTFRASKDAMLDCRRIESGPVMENQCNWHKLPTLFSVEPASGRGCP